MQVWMTSSAKWRSLFWPASLPLAEDFWKWEAAASWWCLRQWFDFLQEEHLASVWICPLFLLRSSKCTGSVCEASTLHILGGKPPPWCSCSRVNYYWKDGSVAAMVSLFRLQIIFNLIYNNFQFVLSLVAAEGWACLVPRQSRAQGSQRVAHPASCLDCQALTLCTQWVLVDIISYVFSLSAFWCEVIIV